MTDIAQRDYIIELTNKNFSLDKRVAEQEEEIDRLTQALSVAEEEVYARRADAEENGRLSQAVDALREQLQSAKKDADWFREHLEIVEAQRDEARARAKQLHLALSQCDLLRSALRRLWVYFDEESGDAELDAEVVNALAGGMDQ
jgi:predicted RNase H-like nuclease (RuvC/YqgF family)